MAEEDILYGKKRHLFGGIEPSNMKLFTAVSEFDVNKNTPAIKLNYALPTDTIINGQTICSIDGAVIRKSIDRYPKDEFDGELVIDIKGMTKKDTKNYEVQLQDGTVSNPDDGNAVSTELTDIMDADSIYVWTDRPADKDCEYWYGFYYKSESSNLLNRATCKEDCLTTWGYDGVVDDMGSLVSDYISVTPGDRLSADYNCEWHGYDINKKYKGSIAGGNFATNNVTVPDGISFVKVGFGSRMNSNVDFTTMANLQIIKGLITNMDYSNNKTNQSSYVGGKYLSVSVVQRNITTGTYIPLRISDFTGYGLYVADGNPPELVDYNVEIGKTYYYAAFPYSKLGVYNRNDANRSQVTTRTIGYLYGYDLDIEDSNPATRVSYPSDVDNYGYAAAAMDYGSGVFDYGDWPSKPGEKFMPSPCMLKKNGTVDHYLNPNDYSKKVDGSASSIADSSFEGNAMMEWPKIYTKRWEENGIYHFRCSNVKLDDDYECWCNYDINNNEIDHFYTAIFRSVTQTSYTTSRSYSGAGVTRELSMTTERTRAKNNGAGWDLEVLADHLLIQDLLVLMAKSTDTQTAYGVGRASSSFVSTGSANASGLFSGANDTSKSVKVFGMEDWWGDLSRRILGLTVYNGIVYAKITKGTKDGSTVDDYTIDNVSGYIPCGTIGTASIYGFINDMTTHPWGRLPFGLKGSSNTYECDYCHFTYSTHSYYPAEVGGGFNITNVNKGAFGCYFSYTAASESNWMTSRLSYKPTLS